MSNPILGWKQVYHANSSSLPLSLLAFLCIRCYNIFTHTFRFLVIWWPAHDLSLRHILLSPTVIFTGLFFLFLESTPLHEGYWFLILSELWMLQPVRSLCMGSFTILGWLLLSELDPNDMFWLWYSLLSGSSLPNSNRLLGCVSLSFTLVVRFPLTACLIDSKTLCNIVLLPSSSFYFLTHTWGSPSTITVTCPLCKCSS